MSAISGTAARRGHKKDGARRAPAPAPGGGKQPPGPRPAPVSGSSQAVLPAAAKLNHPRASRRTPEKPSRSVQPVTLV